MKSEYIDQMVQEILSDMSIREKDPATQPETIPLAFPADAIEEFIQDDDEIGKMVMRRIWRELIETQQSGQMR
jgi:hypothetical protein